MEDQFLQEQVFRLDRLQEALSEAYPEIYKRQNYYVNDYKSLSVATLNECESVCQILLEIEESKEANQIQQQSQNQLQLQSNPVDTGYYIDLIRKLENENEFQKQLLNKMNQLVEVFKDSGLKGSDIMAKSVPGKKLLQRYGNHHVTSSGLMNQSRAASSKFQQISQIEREIQNLKHSYKSMAGLGKSPFKVESGKKQQYSDSHSKQLSVSAERPPKSGNVSFCGDNNIRTISPHIMRREELSNMSSYDLNTIQPAKNNYQHHSATLTSGGDPSRQAAQTHRQFFQSESQERQVNNNNKSSTSARHSVSVSASHTQHRAQVKQVGQLRQELRDLERRHHFVLKDFSKLDEERGKLIKEKDAVKDKAALMEAQLAQIVHQMLSMANQQTQSVEIDTLSSQLAHQKSALREQVQLAQSLQLQLLEKTKELEQSSQNLTRKQQQHEQQMNEVKQTQRSHRGGGMGMLDIFQDTLTFDYQLPKSPTLRANVADLTSKVNKAVQCDDCLGSSQQQYLINKYDDLKSQNQELEANFQSAHSQVAGTKQNVKDLVNSIVRLKKTVTEAYLGKQSNNYKALANEQQEAQVDYQDLEFYCRVTQQMCDIIEANSHSEDKNDLVKPDVMGVQELVQQSSQLQRLFEESLHEIQAVPKSVLPLLNTHQNILTSHVQLFNKIKNLFDLQLVKSKVHKDKVRSLRQNLDKLHQIMAEQNDNGVRMGNDNSTSSYRQLINVNQQQLQQILSLKKQLAVAFNNKENTNNANSGGQNYDSLASNRRSTGTGLSPYKATVVTDQDTIMSPYRDTSEKNRERMLLQKGSTILKSPSQAYADKKLSYMGLKVREAEKSMERAQDSVKELQFLNTKQAEEIERKNTQIKYQQDLLEGMNTKLNTCSHKMEQLQQLNKQLQQAQVMGAQKQVEEHEQLMRNIKRKERDLLQQQQQQLQASRAGSLGAEQQRQREAEQMARELQMLRGQYEREKRIVEDKVRQLTELQSSSIVSVDSLQHENQVLKSQLAETGSTLKAERQANEQQRAQWLTTIQQLKQKIGAIESGCAREIVDRISMLKNEVKAKVDGSTMGKSSAHSLSNDSMMIEPVDQMLKDISQKVSLVVKQRESLQKAVNMLQSDKQQLYSQLQMYQQQQQTPPYQVTTNPFNMNMMMGSVGGHNSSEAGQISRMAGGGGGTAAMGSLDQSMPNLIRTVSPVKLGGATNNYNGQMMNMSMNHTGRSMSGNGPSYPNMMNMQQSLMASRVSGFGGAQTNNGMIQSHANHNSNEENLYEYLQAEIVALRNKKDETQNKLNYMQNQWNDQKELSQRLDIFSRRENIETYQSLIAQVREVLSTQGQGGLLSGIIDEPLLQSKNYQQHVIDQSDDDSVMMGIQNSVKLMGDLETLLPIIGKCFCMVMLERENFHEKNYSLEKMRDELLQQRKIEVDEYVSRDEQSRQALKQIEDNYKVELGYLRTEKDQIVSKSRDFAKNLQQLQKELESRATQVRALQVEVETLRTENKAIEEKTRNTITEQLTKGIEHKQQLMREEAYYKGRKEASEEMTLENHKLRDMIESLRAEVSTKSKKLNGLQFEMDELQKGKKKNEREVEELCQRLGRERDGQKELQHRLDTLLQEVSYLKNVSRHSHAQ